MEQPRIGVGTNPDGSTWTSVHRDPKNELKGLQFAQIAKEPPQHQDMDGVSINPDGTVWTSVHRDPNDELEEFP